MKACNLYIIAFVLLLFAGCSVYSPEQLQRDYPYLDELLKENSRLREATAQYIQLLRDSQRVKDEADLLNVLFYRDSILIPGYERVLHNTDYTKTAHPLFLEMYRLSIFPVAAEGMYTGLAPDYLLQEKFEQVASPELRLHHEFVVQFGRSRAGEYPFVWMEPEKNMLIAGEQLYTRYSKSPYWQKIKTLFDQTLIDFVDIHIVEQEDLTAYFVGGTNMEFWPYVTEIEPRQYLLNEAPDAFFTPALQSILDKPSALQMSQEHVYLVVDEWFRTEGGANIKRLENLYNGKDTPHVLQVELMNGNRQYALVYRYHYDLETAHAYLAHFKKSNPEAEVIKATGWRGETLTEIN